MNQEHAAIVEAVETWVRAKMAGQQAGHGFDHVLRVRHTAGQLQSIVGGDPMVIELACLLHDVGDAKFHQGVERSAEFSREILSRLAVSPNVIESVAEIVDNISFRKRASSKKLSLEGEIVQDADRLDALGAIGIVRTIEYGASVGQPFHRSDNENGATKTGIDHFHEKLFRLRDLLNTDAAREIAAERERFMQTFLDQFYRECGERMQST